MPKYIARFIVFREADSSDARIYRFFSARNLAKAKKDAENHIDGKYTLKTLHVKRAGRKYRWCRIFDYTKELMD